jgi:hypothetical protein
MSPDRAQGPLGEAKILLQQRGHLPHCLQKPEASVGLAWGLRHVRNAGCSHRGSCGSGRPTQTWACFLRVK